jgi:hypothetical protein
MNVRLILMMKDSVVNDVTVVRTIDDSDCEPGNILLRVQQVKIQEQFAV